MSDSNLSTFPVDKFPEFREQSSIGFAIRTLSQEDLLFLWLIFSFFRKYTSLENSFESKPLANMAMTVMGYAALSSRFLSSHSAMHVRTV